MKNRFLKILLLACLMTISNFTFGQYIFKNHSLTNPDSLILFSGFGANLIEVILPDSTNNYSVKNASNNIYDIRKKGNSLFFQINSYFDNDTVYVYQNQTLKATQVFKSYKIISTFRLKIGNSNDSLFSKKLLKKNHLLTFHYHDEIFKSATCVRSFKIRIIDIMGKEKMKETLVNGSSIKAYLRIIKSEDILLISNISLTCSGCITKIISQTYRFYVL